MAKMVKTHILPFWATFLKISQARVITEKKFRQFWKQQVKSFKMITWKALFEEKNLTPKRGHDF